MPRPVRRLVLCLALGAFTSLAVALAIAALTPVPKYPRNATGAFVRWDRPWSASEAHRFGLIHIWWHDLALDEAVRDPAAFMEGAEPPPADEIVQRQREESRERQARKDHTKHPPLSMRDSPRSWGTFTAPEPPPVPFTMGSDAGFGWPFPCLWYQIFTTFNPATMSTVTDEMRGGFVLSGAPASRGDRYRALPLQPAWRGLALDTAFYASLWWLLLFTPPFVRRRMRLRRGHCPKCGYDVQRGYARPCPECGTTPGSPAEPGPSVDLPVPRG